jgi:hypothetical protein
METMRELAHVLEHDFEVVPDSLEAGLRVLRICADTVAHGLHVEADRDESLLCPIVKVALDPAPCLVASGDDSGTRGE